MPLRSRLEWIWSNVPGPEPHIAALLASAVLGQLVRTSPPVRPPGGPRWVATSYVASGAAIGAWAVAAARHVLLDRPDRLVTGGPYRRSRNPMYVAWTLAYVGIAAGSRSPWPWLLLPAVLGWTHAIVLGEERFLEARFGDAWRAYRDATPRYVTALRIRRRTATG